GLPEMVLNGRTNERQTDPVSHATAFLAHGPSRRASRSARFPPRLPPTTAAMRDSTSPGRTSRVLRAATDLMVIFSMDDSRGSVKGGSPTSSGSGTPSSVPRTPTEAGGRPRRGPSHPIGIPTSLIAGAHDPTSV